MIVIEIARVDLDDYSSDVFSSPVAT